MDTIILAIREEEARLSAELKLNPTYRRLRAVRSLLTTYAETGSDTILTGEAGTDQVDTTDPAATKSEDLSLPEEKVQRFPARRRGVSTLAPRSVRKNVIVEDVVAFLLEKGQRFYAKDIIHAMIAKGHQLKAGDSNIQNFSNMLINCGKFNNQRGKNGGYGLKDWPVIPISVDGDKKPDSAQPQAFLEQGSPEMPEQPAQPVPDEIVLEVTV